MVITTGKDISTTHKQCNIMHLQNSPSIHDYITR